MNKNKETYFLLSGEGERGGWEVVETNNIKRLLERERGGGDRWAHAYPVATADYNPKWECVDAIDAETGDYKSIYDDAIIEYMWYIDESTKGVNNE